MIDPIKGKPQETSKSVEIRMPHDFHDTARSIMEQSMPKDVIALTDSARKEELEEVSVQKAGTASSLEKSGESTPKPKKWNVFVYMAGDNNLEQVAAAIMLQLERVGSNEDMNILAQLDRGRKPASSIDGAWKGARRYYVTRGSSNDSYCSEKIADLGQINTADPEVLADFIKWGMKDYPAEKNAIIFYDHGCGFLGALQDMSDGNNLMKISGIHEALKDAEKETGKKFDIVAFDACVMGQAEVAYQLRDDAGILLASEETTSSFGANYQGVLGRYVLGYIKKDIKEKGDVTPREFAEKIVKTTESSQIFLKTFSAIDLEKIEAVKIALDDMSLSLLKTETPRKVILDNIRKTQNFTKTRPWMEPFNDFRDIRDFTANLLKDKRITDSAVKETARRLSDVLKDSIIAEQHKKDYTGAHGLSVYLPDEAPAKDYRYGETAWAKDTHWNEFFEEMIQGAGNSG